MPEQSHELKAMSLVEVVRLSLRLYRDHFGSLLGIAAIGLSPLLLLPVLSQLHFSRYDLVSSFLAVLSGGVIVGLSSVAVGGAIVGKPLPFRKILERFGRGNPFAVLGGASVLAAMVVAWSLLRIALSKAGAAGALVLVLATALTLWALATWSLFAPSAAVENRGVLAALRRSFQLVRGGLWRAVVLQLLLLAVFVGLPAALGRALGLLSKVLAAEPLLALAGVLFAIPVFAAGTSLLYFDFRVRREGFSAAALGAELEGAGVRRAGAERDENYLRKRNALVVVLGANLFLIALKFFLAAVSGSVSIAASGWMSVENFFLTTVVLFGLLVSVRDQRFSRRMSLFENIMALVISGAVLYIAGEMFVMMFVKMAHGAAAAAGGHSAGMHSGMAPAGGVKYVPIVTIAAALGAGICYFISQYEIYVGRACGSASVEAAGRHCRVHVYMEVTVIIGLIGAWIGLDQLALLTSAFVLAYVIYTGVSIFWKGYRGIVSGSAAGSASCHTEHHFNFRLAGGVVAALVGLYAATGIYAVRWNETGVVRRFGTQTALKTPGLHYHLPWPVERAQKVRMDEVRVAKTKPLLLVAGDENIVKVQLGVHYSVKDAADYVFNVGAPDKLVLANVEAAVRKVVGGMSIIGEEEGGSYLLTTGKSEVEEAAAADTQALLDRDRSGVRVVSVQVLALEAPDEVADAFRDIASAMEERQTYIYEAEEYSNQTVTEASGKAQAMVRLAEGYRASKVNNARGEAGAYLQKLSRYQQARAITNIRLYLETMEKILPGVKKVFVDKRIKKETTDLWLMNGELKGKVVGFE